MSAWHSHHLFTTNPLQTLCYIVFFSTHLDQTPPSSPFHILTLGIVTNLHEQTDFKSDRKMCWMLYQFKTT